MSKERKARASEASTEEHEVLASAEAAGLQENGESSPVQQDEGLTSQAADAPSNESVREELEGKLASLEQEMTDLRDPLLRKHADFENFRKRVHRERDEAIRYANANLLLDLVETIDNFERALKSSKESRDFDSFHTGVDMIEKQLTGMLESKYGLKRFESEGNEFDPAIHEAVTAEQSPDVSAQTVIEDLQKGYLLHDRVLRHAKVRVAVPQAPAGDAKPQNETSEDEM